MKFQIKDAGNINEHLDGDIYRLLVDVDGKGWNAVILNELVTARRGEEVEIPVYITREKGANKQANITLIAVSESESKVGSRAVLNIGQ